MVQTEIKTEQNQNSDCCQSAYTAVFPHGVVDPVAGRGVPEDPTDVPQQKCLPRPGGQQFHAGAQLQGFRQARTQQGNQQRRDRNPAQEVDVGQGKDEELQQRREQNQQPCTHMNLPHGGRISNCSPDFRVAGVIARRQTGYGLTLKGCNSWSRLGSSYSKPSSSRAVSALCCGSS